MAGKIWRLFRKPNASKTIPVIVYSRAHCPLCDEAVALLEKYAERSVLEIEVRDVDADAALKEKHGDHVPVVFIDGKERFRGKISEALLARTLNASR